MMKSLGKINKQKAVLFSVGILSILNGFLGVYQTEKVQFFYGYDESAVEYIASFWVACAVVQFPVVVLGSLYNRLVQKGKGRRFTFFFRVGKWFSFLNLVIVAFVFFAITTMYSDGQEAHGRSFWEFSMELYYWEIIILWVAPVYMAFFYMEGALIFLWKRFRLFLSKKN